jgi:hypothetical protein
MPSRGVWRHFSKHLACGALSNDCEQAAPSALSAFALDGDEHWVGTWERLGDRSEDARCSKEFQR